jgi:hypothetical protein
MIIRSIATALFLLHAALAVCFLVQCYYAVVDMEAEVPAECAPSPADVPGPPVPRRSSWAPFLVAFAAGGMTKMLGKPTPLDASASNWELARRDFLGKLHASA